ncbi:MAG: Phage-related protein [Rhodoferax sp.]|nr:Phage-related protein [Rhodoferax sp.]
MPFAADVYALVAPAAGCAVVWAEQDAPQPVKPFMALRLGTSTGPEHEIYEPVDEAGFQLVRSHREVVLEIQCYGVGAVDLLETLKQRLRWQTTIDVATRLNLAVLDHGGVQNITALLDTAFHEPRGMLEIGIRRLQASTDDVGLIETVNIDGTITGGVSTSIPAHVTVEIITNGQH